MRIQDIFFRNFWWKLASLVLATLIWINYVYPRDRGQQTDKHSIPLKLMVTPVASNADVRRFTADPPAVTVRLEGADGELPVIGVQDIQARVFLTDALRTNGARVKVEISGLPPGASLRSIVPDQVTIQTRADP